MKRKKNNFSQTISNQMGKFCIHYLNFGRGIFYKFIGRGERGDYSIKIVMHKKVIGIYVLR